MSKNNISDFSKCSNCGACYNICPVQAINVATDDLFYQVKVDAEKCIECGLCKKVCSVNTPQKKQNLFNAYAAVNCDAEVVKKSSSGGAFSAIADLCLAQGGVVYGAAYSDDCRIVEMKSTSEVALSELRRSKYVESKVGNSFRQVKENLDQQKMVLYCGAPCQIAGLKRYLGKEYDNLITCDFSCGGMPSHKFYWDYLDNVEKELHSTIINVNFRPKIYGWARHAVQIAAVNGKKYSRNSQNDPYFHCFIDKHISVREYCYDCAFTNNHYSDLILADYWKCNESKVINNDSGISLILSNSPKGENIIRQLGKEMSITVLDLERASYNLYERKSNPEFMEKRKLFLEECRKNGFINVTEKLQYPSKLKFLVKYYLKKILLCLAIGR